MDKVRNPSNSVCYTPSSEPYRIYLVILMYLNSRCVGVKFVLSHEGGEHRLSLWEGRLGENVEGVGWGRLHNEELHNLFSSPYIIRLIKSWRMRLAGHVEHMGDFRNPHRKFSSKRLEGRRLLGRHTRWFEDNIKTIGVRVWIGIIWLEMALVANSCWNFGIHKIVRISWRVGRLLASQYHLFSLELVMNPL
jgi:hypothetical protein